MVANGTPIAPRIRSRIRRFLDAFSFALKSAYLELRPDCRDRVL